MNEAKSFDALSSLLRIFGEENKMISISYSAKKIDGFIPWEWENPVVLNGNGQNNKSKLRGYISAKFPVLFKGREFGLLKFGWISEDNRISPEKDILLQLVADIYGEKLSEISHERHQ